MDDRTQRASGKCEIQRAPGAASEKKAEGMKIPAEKAEGERAEKKRHRPPGGGKLQRDEDERPGTLRIHESHP